jgi:hypothetical protein
VLAWSSVRRPGARQVSRHAARVTAPVVKPAILTDSADSSAVSAGADVAA